MTADHSSPAPARSKPPKPFPDFPSSRTPPGSALRRFAFDARFIPRPVTFGPECARPNKRPLHLERARKGLRMFESAGVRPITAG
jgi:hypothetical protein